jgi:hypothetical protein
MSLLAKLHLQGKSLDPIRPHECPHGTSNETGYQGLLTRCNPRDDRYATPAQALYLLSFSPILWHLIGSHRSGLCFLGRRGSGVQIAPPRPNEPLAQKQRSRSTKPVSPDHIHAQAHAEVAYAAI